MKNFYKFLARIIKRISNFHYTMFHRTNYLYYNLDKKAKGR